MCVQQIRETISMNFSKIAICENLDSRKFSTIRYSKDVILYKILVSLCLSANMESSVTLGWTHFQALVEMYAKDEGKRAEMLKYSYPSQHLLEVVPVQEPQDTLSPGMYTT